MSAEESTPQIPAATVQPSSEPVPGKVFIGNLPPAITEEGLRELVKDFGVVESVYLRPTPKTLSVVPKPYGFVTFENPEDAEKCISGLDGVEKEAGSLVVRQDRGKKQFNPTTRRVGGRTTRPRIPPAYGRQLFVGNLHFKTSWQDLKDYFRGDESEFEVVRAEIFMQAGTTKSKGCGVVVMQSEEDAKAAILKFNGKEMHSREIVVKMDMPPSERPNYKPTTSA